MLIMCRYPLVGTVVSSKSSAHGDPDSTAARQVATASSVNSPRRPSFSGFATTQASCEVTMSVGSASAPSVSVNATQLLIKPLPIPERDTCHSVPPGRRFIVEPARPTTSRRSAGQPPDRSSPGHPRTSRTSPLPRARHRACTIPAP